MRLFAPLLLSLATLSATFVQSTGAQHYVLDTRNHNGNSLSFCPHISSRDTVTYQQWFNDVCKLVQEKVVIFDRLRMTNIFVPHKAFTHCSQSIDVLIETYHDTLEARRAIQFLASELKADTNVDIAVYYSIRPFGEAFGDRPAESGQYIMQNQILLLDRDTPAPPYEEVFIRRMALESNIRLSTVSLQPNRIKVSLLPPAAHEGQINANNIRHFLYRTQTAFGKPVEITQERQ